MAKTAEQIQAEKELDKLCEEFVDKIQDLLPKVSKRVAYDSCMAVEDNLAEIRGDYNDYEDEDIDEDEEEECEDGDEDI